jgi:hypothetical protein
MALTAQAHTLLYGHLDEMADIRGLSRLRFEVSFHHPLRDGTMQATTTVDLRSPLRSNELFGVPSKGLIESSDL